MPARRGQAGRYALIPYPPSLGCWPAPTHGHRRGAGERPTLPAYSCDEILQITARATASKYGQAPAPVCLCPHGSTLRRVVRRLLCLRARWTAASECPLALVYDALSHIRHGGNGYRASPESQRLAPLLCG